MAERAQQMANSRSFGVSSFKGEIDISIGIDVDVDIDSDMDVSIPGFLFKGLYGSFKGVWRSI